MAKGPERLVRWIMEHTQPVPYSLDIEHPAMDDIAWAADEIERLQAELRANMEGSREALRRVGELESKLDQCLHVVREYVSSELADDPSQDDPSCQLYSLIELVRNTTVK